MKDLFSPEGLQALRAFVTQPLLCLFDFDGTLAPLVADPDAALLPPAVQAQLQSLQRCAPVGIVTGRALDDLRSRLSFRPDYLVGNHGLEGVPAAPAPADLRDRVVRWKQQLEPVLLRLDPGIRIEDKHYSLSLHYLHAQDRQRAGQALLACLEALQPAPRIIHGKYLFNVLPAGAGDKGSAVQALLASSGIAQALYVGDDSTDEDVFRLPLRGLFTVHVGDPDSVHSDVNIGERGGGTASAALWCLQTQAQVGQLLDWLLREMPAGRR